MPAPAVNITTAASPVPRSSPTDTGVAFVVGMSTQGPSRLLTSRRQDRQPQRLDRPLRRRHARERAALLLGRLRLDRHVLPGGRQRALLRARRRPDARLSDPQPRRHRHDAHRHRRRVRLLLQPVQDQGHQRPDRRVRHPRHPALPERRHDADRPDRRGRDAGRVQRPQARRRANVPVTITLGGGSGLPTVAAATALSAARTTGRTSRRRRSRGARAPVHRPRPRPGRRPELADQRPRTSRCSRTPRPTTGSRSATPSTRRRSRDDHHERRRAEGHHERRLRRALPPVGAGPALATGGSARSVPPSALVAGKIAQNDPTDTPSQSPAGQWGTAAYATNVNATWARVPAGTSDADTLADAGVNLVVVKNGAVTIYDILTLAATDDEFQQVGVAGGGCRPPRRSAARPTRRSSRGSTATRSPRGRRRGRDPAPPVPQRPALRRPRRRPARDGVQHGRRHAEHADDDQRGQMNMNVAARPVKGGRILNISIAAVPITAAVA
jgi:hypothetical protein